MKQKDVEQTVVAGTICIVTSRNDEIYIFTFIYVRYSSLAIEYQRNFVSITVSDNASTNGLALQSKTY